jgi:hypothetical protein
MSKQHKGDGKQIWTIDPNYNLKDALGFLKDWVTTFLTLQTSIIAAAAVFVGIHGVADFKQLWWLQKMLLVAAAIGSLVSIWAGLYLLNLIPAAAQRKATTHPGEEPQDLFSIATDGKTIKFIADVFRKSFLAAISVLVVFVVVEVTGIF